MMSKKDALLLLNISAMLMVTLIFSAFVPLSEAIIISLVGIPMLIFTYIIEE